MRVSDGKKIDMFSAEIPASRISVEMWGGVRLSKNRI
jgi:hypothetical protein